MTLKHWAIFIGLTIIWGASFLWIKIAVQETGPFTIVAIRLVLALVALAGFMIVQRPELPRGRMWFYLAIQGVISTAIPWLAITWAEKHIDSALATVLNGTVPLFTIVMAHHFLTDDKMTRKRVLGLLLGFAGVLVLVFDDVRLLGEREDVKWQLLGQGAMLVGTTFYAASNVYARAKLRGVPPIVQAFYTMLAADIVMWMITPAIEAPFTLPRLGMTWLAIAWLGVLGAGISYLMFYHLLHAIGPTRSAMVTYTIPLVGVTLGVVFLGEALTWQLVAGTLLIVSGVWGATRE